MTKEYREQLQKKVDKLADQTKDSIRKVRKEGMDKLKTAKKNAAEDLIRKLEKDVCISALTLILDH